MFDPELRLVVDACRAAFTSADWPRHSGQKVDWGRLYTLADRHRVQALCWHGLGDAKAQVPVAVADRFSEASTSIVQSNLRSAAECARLVAIFDKAGIDLLFLKGLTLGALAYPNPMLKMAWDIDLLVAPDQLLEASELLEQCGYRLVVPTASREMLQRWHGGRKESVWFNEARNFTVDLHTRLSDHPAMLSSLSVRSATQDIEVAPSITLPTLASDELFAYLCVHGASSAWFRLKWICDLAALLQPRTAGEIVRLFDRAQQLGAGRSAGQALLLANKHFGTPLTDHLANTLAADSIVGRLARLAEKELRNPREPSERLLGTAAIHLSQPFLMPGWRFSLSDVVRQSRDLLERATA